MGSASDWRAIQWLAWVDVINSVTWIIVVAVLEVDVWLQLRGTFFRAGEWLVSKYLKMGLYGILLACRGLLVAAGGFS